jgi:hypothetical protein
MIELIQTSFVLHGSIPQGVKLGANILAFQPSICIPQRVKLVQGGPCGERRCNHRRAQSRGTGLVSLTIHRGANAAKMAPVIHLLAIATLLLPCYSYVDLEQGQDNTLDYIPRIPIPRPWQLPLDEEMQVDDLPSMITAIAPSTTMASNGTLETMYRMHYHKYFVPSRQGTGIFKRGVFAGDPPMATCTPCGFQGTIVTPNATATNTSPTATCTLKTYLVCIHPREGRDDADICPGCLPILRRRCGHNKYPVLLRLELLWCVRAVHNLVERVAVLFHHPGLVSIKHQCQHVIYVHNWRVSIQHHDAVFE